MPAGLSFGLGIGTTATYADSRPGQPGTGRCDVALSSTVRTAFEQVLPPDGRDRDPVRCRAYECDGLTGYRVVPELVLLPRDAAQVAAAVRVCAEHGVPFVARGAGTGLSGGALPGRRRRGDQPGPAEAGARGGPGRTGARSSSRA